MYVEIDANSFLGMANCNFRRLLKPTILHITRITKIKLIPTQMRTILLRCHQSLTTICTVLLRCLLTFNNQYNLS